VLRDARGPGLEWTLEPSAVSAYHARPAWLNAPVSRARHRWVRIAPNGSGGVSRQEAEMRSFQALIGLGLVIGTTVVAGQAVLPKDIYPETGNRFPSVKRDALNEAGKKIYDARVDAFGPGSIRLYSQPVADSMTELNDYLR